MLSRTIAPFVAAAFLAGCASTSPKDAIKDVHTAVQERSGHKVHWNRGTEEDKKAEEALMKQVPLHDPDRCAKIFREHGFSRSPTAIVVRAKRLDLSRRYRETLSATQIGKLLGVDGKTVTREILQGDLKAEKRPTNRLNQQGGDPWSVTPAASSPRRAGRDARSRRRSCPAT